MAYSALSPVAAGLYTLLNVAGLTALVTGVYDWPETSGRGLTRVSLGLCDEGAEGEHGLLELHLTRQAASLTGGAIGLEFPI